MDPAKGALGYELRDAILQVRGIRQMADFPHATHRIFKVFFNVGPRANGAWNAPATLC